MGTENTNKIVFFVPGFGSIASCFLLNTGNPQINTFTNCPKTFLNMPNRRHCKLTLFLNRVKKLTCTSNLQPFTALTLYTFPFIFRMYAFQGSVSYTTYLKLPPTRNNFNKRAISVRGDLSDTCIRHSPLQ